MQNPLRMRTASRAILLLFLLFIGVVMNSSKLLAQNATGAIVGIVHDPSGNVIAGAQVTLLDVTKSQTVAATTNNLGYYSFPVVQPGLYRETVQAPGFRQFVQENITIDVATTVSIDAHLQVGEVSQSVTVSNAPPLLETQDSSIGQVISNESIVNLPLDGRNAYGFAALTGSDSALRLYADGI